MSAAGGLLNEDQFLCSICLDVFTDPVSTPCGHNFCKACITEHWNSKVPCDCPNCNKVFSIMPELLVNTFISEMADQFRQSAKQTTAKVPFYVFSRSKLNALMFCLVFPIFVCMLYAVFVHKTHDVVPLTEEYVEKMVELRKTEAKILQMIQKRQQKIQEMRRSVELSNEGADREITDGVQVFTALKESVERSQAELIDTVKEKQRETEKQAEGFIKELEQEISELEKRSTEVEQLPLSEDHLHLLQNFQSINAALSTKDWTEISVRPPSYEGTVVRAVNQLEVKVSEQMKKLFEAELKRVQQYAVDVTLDPDTAHSPLFLSDDGKQVEYGDVKKKLPDHPKRFDHCCRVLSKQSFSSGRFYYEVQVEGNTDWDLGVARESINRKGYIELSLEEGYWTISLEKKNYKALDTPAVRLSLKSPPQKVGVFVDYEEGLVSFYDVDAAALIYSFTGCSFTEKLHPFFSLFVNDDGKSHAPLIISSVNQQEEKHSEQMKKLFEDELKKVQQFAVDVTLDPNTAHPHLILSDDGKQVKHGDIWKNLADNAQRFDTCAIVLSKQSFSSGKFYYEIQVEGKTDWDLGVVRESINRKGLITASPQNGYWTICLRNKNNYGAFADPQIHLSLKSPPQKVGVFVDYEEGLVSFYDVDAAALIYSFTRCSFTEKLYPLFSPFLNAGGKNSAPLIISPVNL